jgi:N-acetylneuraminic acid mutarotase
MSDLPDLLERFADEGGERGAANVFAAAVDALGERRRRRRTRAVVATAVALTIATGGIAAIAVGAHHDGLKVQTTTPAQSVAPAPSPTATGPIVPPPPAPAAADAGTWSLAPFGPAAVGAPEAWTGKEVLVAGAGCCEDLGSINYWAYNPASKKWRALPPTPLTPRAGAAGAWTGSEMVVAGGFASADGSAIHASAATDGAAWNAATNSWHRIAAMPTTLVGTPTAVWTGREVLVWSSSPAAGPAPGREVVLAYNPTSNHWRTLPASGLAPRGGAITAWTGAELFVWSGDTGSGSDAVASTGRFSSDGARLDPATNTWRRLPAAPVPARGVASAVWSGHEVLLWGGVTANGTDVGKGAAYNPATNTWRALPASPLRAKASAAGVWTGRYFIVIGGAAGYNLPTPGPGAAAYNPATNTWTALPAAPPYPLQPGGPTFAADQREAAFAVWTGKSVVLVGGLDFSRQAPRSDGLVWTPAG